MPNKTSLRHLLLALLAILAVWSLPVAAQPAAADLDTYFSKAHSDWKIPGMAIGVIKDGQVVLAKGYGALKHGGTEMADAQSLFAIASNTKAFVSAALGILVDEGKLSWDDPVIKHLPYFQLYDPYVSQQATVRDLLCHRVGLGTFSGDVIWYKSEYSAEEVLRRAAHVPQAYGFRSGYGYSNLMFIAAGEVIRAVSGQPWDEFVRARIFLPLGMARSQTSVAPLAKMTNVAQPHKTLDGDIVPIPYAKWDNMGAAGGIVSSVDDVLKWAQLHIDGGQHAGKAIFSPAAQQQMWQPHNNYAVSPAVKKRFPSRHVAGYALGWGYFDHAGKMVYSHGGGYDGMYSKVAIVPEAKLGIVVLTNGMKGISDALMYYVLEAYLSEQPTTHWSNQGLVSEGKGLTSWKSRVNERASSRVLGTKPSLPQADLAGTYHCPMYGDIRVAVDKGQLQLDFAAAPALAATLSHWHHDTYEIKWAETHAWFDFGTVQFVMDNNHQVTELRFDVPNDDIFFEEIKAVRQPKKK